MFTTRNRSHAARMVAAVAALSLFAAACGSDEVETVAPVTTTATTTAAPETTAAPATTDAPTTTTATEQPAEVEVVAEPEPVAETSTTTIAPEPEPEPVTEEPATPDTTLPPEPEPEPVREPDPEVVADPEPEVPEDEPTVTTLAPEPEPTVTTLAPEPEPEPETEPEPQRNPTITVTPSTVEWLGFYDFTVMGANFTPNSQTFLVVCTAPGDALSPDTPTSEVTAAMARITRDDCDLANLNPVTVGADGSFTAEVGGTVGAVNFVWVASDITETETAAAPVFAENLEQAPVVLRPGVWVPPEAGMVPPVFPICTSSPYAEDCIPPNAWDRGEIDPAEYPTELPRRQDEVVGFFDWCKTQFVEATCTRMLTLMKWPIDYLGASPVCVVNEYEDRINEYKDGSWPENVEHLHGWHNCATVIDPMIGGWPEGRYNDIGYRLSDTGISVADQCRMVLPPDIELENEGDSFGAPATERYGNDCDAWGQYVVRRIKAQERTRGDCTASYYLAREWMEHYHGVPENYYPIAC